MNSNYHDQFLEASKHGNLDNVTSILEDNSDTIDVDYQDKDGSTALMHASTGGFSEIVGILVNCNADVNKSNSRSSSPLSVAAANGHPEIVHLLLQVEADVNVEDHFGSTSLTLACMNGHEDVIQVLLGTQGVDVNKADNNGNASLHYAVEQSSLSIVRMLIEANADVNIKDKYGNTPLLWASTRGLTEIVEALLEAEAVDISISNNYGEKPILACDSADIRVLLSKHMEKHKVFPVEGEGGVEVESI